MKSHFHVSALTLLALSGGVLCGQQARPADFLPDRSNTATGETRSMVKYTLLEPNDKTSELVKPEERNPFAKTEDDLKGLNAKGSNEENVIRTHLEKLRVVGASPGPNGLRVMLGDMVLESGQIVPPVVPDQNLSLKVGAISPQSIELIWLEKKPSSLPARKLTIPVELRPAVRFLLQGQLPASSRGEKKTLAKIGQRPLGSQILKEPRMIPNKNEPLTGPPEPVGGRAPAGEFNPDPAPDTIRQSESAPTPTASNSEPKSPTWETAIGFLNNLAKLKDANK